MLLFLQAIALDLAAIQRPQSELVDADHTHDWIVINHEMKRNEEVTLLDRTPTPVFVDAMGQYPTALLRGAEASRGGELYELDVIFAIDCSSSAIAVAQVWERTPEGDTSKRDFPTSRKFQPAGDAKRDRKTRDAIFTHVCGHEWSYRPSK